MSLSSIGVGGVGGGSITVKEVDGAPTVTTDTLRFPNASLTDDGGGQATVAFPAASALTVKEVDGAPSVSATTLRFPNGTLTDDGGGQVTYTAAAVPTPTITVKEVDAAPSVATSTLRFPNGTLTDDGGGQVTYTAATVTGGITAVSSLGAAGTAGAAKFLTTDNKLYIDDGSLWRPVESPGFPRRDGSDDYEAEGTNSDPPTGWTWENQDSTVVDVNNAMKSWVVLTKSVTGSNISSLYKSVTGLSSKRFYALVNVLPDTSEVQYGQTAQIGIRNSSNGRLFLLRASHANGGLSMIAQKWTAYNSFSSNAFLANSYDLLSITSSVVLSIRGDSTNIIFEYAPYLHGSEGVFQTIFSETIATFIGSMDQACFGVYKSSGTQVVGTFDWLRFA